MLYEFALLPDVIEEIITNPEQTNQQLFINLLERLLENGMLANLKNGEWSKHIYKLFDGLYIGDTGYILDLLYRLENYNRMVLHSANSTSVPSDWLDEAKHANDMCHLNGIILSSTVYNKIKAPPVEYCPFPPSHVKRWTSWYGKRSTRNFKKCESDFISVLSPIFRHANRVDLIDPYFNCHRKEYKKTMQICVNLIKSEQNRVPIIVIHAGDPTNDIRNPESPNNRILEWKAFLNSLPLSQSMIFRVFLWGMAYPEKPHNRYIFTDQFVGLSLPNGLDCYEPAKARSDSLDLKDVEETQRLWQEFTSVPIYTPLKNLKVERLMK